MTRVLLCVLLTLGPVCGYADDGIVIHHDEITQLRGALPTDYMSYQGELLEDEVPVDGPVDFRFRFWDSPTSGSQLGVSTVLAVPVNGGRFSTFVFPSLAGANQISYMEVEVSRAQPPNFVSLGRQQLGAVPYSEFAQHANSAGLADTAVTATFANTATQANTSVMAATAQNALAPWVLAAGSLNYAGKVGINTTISSAALHVESAPDNDLALRVRGTSEAGYAAWVEGVNAAALYALNSSAQGGTSIYSRLTGAAGSAITAFAEASSGDVRGITAITQSADGYAGYFLGGRNYLQGSTGIGVANPSDKLHIVAAPGQSALRIQVDGATKLRVNANGGVAIGVNASPPADGLFVQGEIQTPPRTRWLSIDGRGFSLDSSAWIEGQTIGTQDPLRLNRRAADSRNDVWISAAAALPHAAVVTELRAHAKDDSSTTNLRVSLMRRVLATGTTTTMASVITNGASSAIQSPATTSIAQATIDNQNHSYYLVAQWDTGLTGVEVDRTLLHAVRVTYTTTNPGP